MKAKIYSVGILAVLALAAAALAADGFSVAQKPKKDDHRKYSMKADIDLAGTQVAISATTAEKVTDVATDGSFTLETSQLEMKITINGGEQDVPSGNSISEVYKPSGEISKVVGDAGTATPGAYRMANLTLIFDPGKTLNIGDAWSHDIKADAATGAVAAKADYKLLGEEKIGTFDTLKIQFTIKELGGDQPASADGTEWIDKTDGSMVRTEAKWVNAPVPGAPGPVNATVKLNRV